jgi:hypothetical protein
MEKNKLCSISSITKILNDCSLIGFQNYLLKFFKVWLNARPKLQNKPFLRTIRGNGTDCKKVKNCVPTSFWHDGQEA